MKESIKNILPKTVDNYYQINIMNEIEKKLQEEVSRYKDISKNALILMEQAEPTDIPPVPGEELPLPPIPGAGDVPPAPETPEAPDTTAPLAGEDGTDPAAETEPVDPVDDDTTEEVDITDLVNMTKNIKQDLESSKTDNDGVIQKMDGVFSKLSELESMIGNMDNVINKIDELGSKVEEMKPETPQEKLEMRSLDSYPFNEKPDEFFDHKQEEMKKAGKNEYVLTKDDVANYNKEDIKQSFNDRLNDDDVSV